MLEGIGMLLLAVAASLLPALLVGARPRAVWWVLGGVISLAGLVVGAATLVSGLTGHVVSVPGLVGVPVVILWILWWPITLVAAGIMSLRLERPGGRWRFVVVALLCMSSWLPLSVFAPMVLLYQSHDTTPWTGAVGGVLLIAAALAAWPAMIRRPAEPSGEKPGPRTSSAPAVAGPS